MGKILEIVVRIMILLLVAKVIIGIHWDWEKCECCGKKWKEIRKEKKQKGDD